MNFSGGNKGALRIPSLSFQYPRRPGCTAKLLCFLIAGRFESHRLHQCFGSGPFCDYVLKSQTTQGSLVGQTIEVEQRLSNHEANHLRSLRLP